MADRALQGSPLHVAVRIEAPPDSPGSVVLAPVKGSWTDAVVVELADATSGKVVAHADVVGKSESNKATLDQDTAAGGIWRFAPQSLVGLPPGEYLVRARLSINAGPGWTGSETAPEAKVTLVAATDPAISDKDRVLARAWAYFQDYQDKSAADVLDPWLSANPRSVEALTLRAYVAERAGDLPIAMACARLALTLQESVAMEAAPPESFEIEQRMEERARADDPAFTTSLEAFWAWPASVPVMAALLTIRR